jgi:hypothetical protein
MILPFVAVGGFFGFVAPGWRALVTLDQGLAPYSAM